MMAATAVVPPSTVKTAAKALSIWPHCCVEGHQARMHSCTDSSVQLISSSPMYMSSSDSDSHIIAAAEGGRSMTGLRSRTTVGRKESHGDSYLSQTPGSRCESPDTSLLKMKGSGNANHRYYSTCGHFLFFRIICQIIVFDRYFQSRLK